MNSRDQEKLLKEILPPEGAADFRNTSLAHGLAGLRRERRRRQVGRFSAVLVVLLGLFLGVIFKSRNQFHNDHVVTQAAPQPAPFDLAAGHVEIINDDQLLAIFTNQPVALIGKPGEQRLVFLGKSKNDSAQNRF